MTREELIERFANMTTWRRRGERAPHKPLLILYALGRMYQGERWLYYSDLEDKLNRLLAEFGPPRKSYRAYYPFIRLVNDGVWQLNKDIDTRTDHSPDFLKQEEIAGSFNEDVFNALGSNPQLVQEIAGLLLEQNFPETMHQEILEAVDLADAEYSIIRRRKRNPEFRQKVLELYGYRCAVCGFDIKLGTTPIALEAAHIKWHQAGGPDVEENGIAMCSMHHKLFDRGAFTFDKSLTLLVSDVVTGTVGLQEWLYQYQGKKLRKPASPIYYPARVYLDWHFREVYRDAIKY
ncbi:MAG: phosphorothioated DNA-binding restriction endonuclease [Limnochordia bacterium]